MTPWNKKQFDNVDLVTTFIDMHDMEKEYVAPTVSQTGNIFDTSNSKGWGSVYHPNGKIYIAPTTGFNALIEYDPATDTFVERGSFTGAGMFQGICVAPNNMIYMIPYGADSEHIVKYNPYTNTFTNIGNFGSASPKWGRGVLHSNGKIYAFPVSNGSILEIDTETDTYTTYGSLSGSMNFQTCALGGNGNIYAIPRNATAVYEFDPVTKAITSFGSLSGTDKFYGSCTGADGKIYCMPWGASYVLVVDPYTKSVSTYGSLGTSIKFADCIAMTDGRIYGIMQTATRTGMFNPLNNTVTYIGATITGTNKWCTGTLAPDGTIYGFPQTNRTVLKIKFEKPVDVDICLSRINNRG